MTPMTTDKPTIGRPYLDGSPPDDRSKMTRNERIIALRADGYTLQQIANLFGISRQRVGQIVPRVGRPYIDGKPAGQGERVVTKCITLPPDAAAYLKAVGGGNLSKGVRVVARYYQDTHRKEQEQC